MIEPKEKTMDGTPKASPDASLSISSSENSSEAAASPAHGVNGSSVHVRMQHSHPEGGVEISQKPPAESQAKESINPKRIRKEAEELYKKLERLFQRYAIEDLMVENGQPVEQAAAYQMTFIREKSDPFFGEKDERRISDKKKHIQDLGEMFGQMKELEKVLSETIRTGNILPRENPVITETESKVKTGDLKEEIETVREEIGILFEGLPKNKDILALFFRSYENWRKTAGNSIRKLSLGSKEQREALDEAGKEFLLGLFETEEMKGVNVDEQKRKEVAEKIIRFRAIELRAVSDELKAKGSPVEGPKEARKLRKSRDKNKKRYAKKGS
ncbi:MAG: hypothetical protein ABI747_02035 [Candidatus Moraniibacteriota bacterium]